MTQVGLLFFFCFPYLLLAEVFGMAVGEELIFHLLYGRTMDFCPKQHLSKFIVMISSIMFWLGVAALITAMAGPEVIHQEEVQLSRGLDIMIVLDQSASMGAKDFPPENRFNTARELIRKLIDNRENDSIGLVSFGSDAILQSPSTTDRDWLLNRFGSIAIAGIGR